MQINIERYGSLNLHEYQHFVDMHPQGTPYHHPGWLLAAEQAYGHRAWVISVRDKGQLQAVMPVCQLRRPGGGPLVSLPFCDMAGPLSETVQAGSDLGLGASRLMADVGAKALLVRRPEGGIIDEDMSARETYRNGQKVSMVFQLPAGSERLFSSYKPKLRSQIRKAEKNGLVASIETGLTGLEAFYPVFAANMRRLGSPVHGKSWFGALAGAYGDRLVVGVVRSGERVVGAGIVLTGGSRACIPWASTLAEYNHLAPNMLLYWRLLSYLSDGGFTEFDFGRSSFEEGTYRFKKQWGAKPARLCWEHWLADGSLQPCVMAETSPARIKVRSLIQACWQKLPLVVANWLGPHLRKHISL